MKTLEEILGALAFLIVMAVLILGAAVRCGIIH